jgi:hypothetical protein
VALAALYAVAAFSVVFGFAMTIEADNSGGGSWRRDGDGAFAAFLCVGLAELLKDLLQDVGAEFGPVLDEIGEALVVPWAGIRLRGGFAVRGSSPSSG